MDETRDGTRPVGHRMLRLVEVMDTLRRECPWDRSQTHGSLAKYLIQEAYETLETIEEGDLALLREELGDVLLQVVFHAAIASERPEGDPARFTVDDVADAIIDKMTRRHPHVFGGAEVSGADEVRSNWETIKAAERAEKARAGGGDGRTSVLDGVPFAQPAVMLAHELQKRAVRNGFPADLVDDDGAEGGELFAAVSAERDRGRDAEIDLRAAARRFDARVRAAEEAARADGREPRELSEEEWRAYWAKSGNA
ncbi:MULTISPECIES: MazG family protein [Nocardiopsis]|uniref:Nucleotide pyrophosphohydrolase n=1 Tax=Nocardiopsis sinuspersici TaxID=501010 RepID=A0A1V3C7U0_9ACTN|nr:MULTISPECIES: MazG family protein [Nocardiopsis]NYH53516.1 XTP/dITP diphosphohydrolase [Nocardiopsis sinuspersici]OOC56834.1 nucleotide pyrophosphohydrolase [Nocardiopsis sinuspersici]